MEAIIVNRPALRLVGLAVQVTLQEVLQDRTTFKLGSAFMSRKGEIMSIAEGNTVYGLSTDPEGYDPDTDPFEYFIGMEVTSTRTIPDGMVVREIPANTYAVFTFQGHEDNAGEVHHYLYSTWLKEQPYELCGLYNVEVYDERNKGPESEESITDIWFPVRRKPALA
ncbi:GyrI-like domain-containing protein [Paenibacillus sp. HJGM_3]|uniref:GyrI-like domain-containing protein n=1 Tax=Paenibacillus sp. HJGM_3 TaxID=3379816 RepID=UPI00385B03C3